MIPVKTSPLWRCDYSSGTAYAGFNTKDEADAAIASINDTKLHGKLLVAHHHVPYSPKVSEAKDDDATLTDNTSITTTKGGIDDDGCIQFEFIEFNSKATHKDFEAFFDGYIVKSVTYVIQPRFLVHKHKRVYVRITNKETEEEVKDEEKTKENDEEKKEDKAEKKEVTKFNQVDLLELFKLRKLAGEPVTMRLV